MTIAININEKNIKNINLTAIASDFEFIGGSIDAAEGEGPFKKYGINKTICSAIDIVFDNNEINEISFFISKKYNTTSPSSFLESHNKKNKTVAYLVIKNDSLYYEKYYDGYGLDSKSNSFSMSKSIVSALLGKAIMDGYIESLDQPVYQFLPEIKGSYSKIVTLGDLSSMSSGLDWQEQIFLELQQNLTSQVNLMN